MNGVLYKLTSPSGKSYFGITTDFARRMRSHALSAKAPKTIVAYAIKKHGWTAMRAEIQVRGSYEYVKALEKKAVALFGTRTPYGYNHTPGGDGLGAGVEALWYGRKHSDATKKKLSAIVAAHARTEESCSKQAATMKAAYAQMTAAERANKTAGMHSEEARRAAAASRVGKPQSEESRRKRSETMKRTLARKRNIAADQICID